MFAKTIGLAPLFITAFGVLSSPALAEGPPQTGVYECMSQDGLAPTLMFGLIDDTSYGNYDGLRGHYRYDAKLRQVIFTDGPFKGLHYLRGENPDPVKGTGSMRMLDEHGKVTAINHPSTGPRTRPSILMPYPGDAGARLPERRPL